MAEDGGFLDKGLEGLNHNFLTGNRDNVAEDHGGATVFLARNDWQLNRVKQDWPDIRLSTTREHAQ